MRVPLSWLKDFTPVQASPEEVAHALSFLGLVVEGVERADKPWAGIIVARVLETRPHPSADRIQLVDVDMGDGEALQICCGAFNMKSGDLVPLAALGAVMPNGLEIARRKMRGEWSNGMLCSVPELGLGEEGLEKGIYVLPGDLPVGQPLAEALGVGDDVVFDLDIGPNRPDCFSIAGVARDLAAFLNLPFNFPPMGAAAVDPAGSAAVVDPAGSAALVEIAPDATELCPRFTATVIEGVRQAAVPAWVSRRVSLAGMRPINPVVDASNYVMLEIGQPNHPYDMDKLAGGSLQVRRAYEGEVLVTLDGAARELCPDDLVIAGGDGEAVGLAGVMGGATAEISPLTNTVLFEAANFDALSVARTGKRLGLSSEARARFERGVDIELAGLAVERFVSLLGPAVRRGPTTDLGRQEAPKVTAVLRAQRAALLLGVPVSANRCAELLTPLGFQCEPAGDERLAVTMPSWRPDCTREVDLIEEIARMHGYENIPRQLPARPMAATSLSREQKARRLVRDIIAGTGANEAWTTSFLSAEDMEKTGLSTSRALELENPLDQSQGLLRTSVLPGLLRSLQFNVERQIGAVQLFEIGNVFLAPLPGERGAYLAEVDEREQLGLVAIGRDIDARWSAQAWEVLRGGLRLRAVRLADEAAPPGTAGMHLDAFHPGRRAVISAQGRPVGVVGELSPKVTSAYGFSSRVAALVVDLAPVLGAVTGMGAAQAVSRFPATDMDMAFEVDEGVAAGDVAGTVESSAGQLLTSLALFDVYKGPGLGEGKRSLGFRLRLRAGDRTLTEAEVTRVRVAVADAVSSAHGGVLRVG
ncbi:MAG TPA: phenylalanine--tRNA ligase subunit beta [Acidimicrobiales bacterium]|nr:phenylalanine--tRNA ligase subunit beta [Acidimicrobiales bacterium]